MQSSNRCPETRELLPDFVEGDLDALAARRVQGHLEICGACRREEAACRAALSLLNAPAARQPRPHGDLYAGFAAKVARHEAPANRAGRFPRPGAPLRWAAACGALAIVATAGAAYLPGVVRRLETANGGAATVARVAPAPAPPIAPGKAHARGSAIARTPVSPGSGPAERHTPTAPDDADRVASTKGADAVRAGTGADPFTAAEQPSASRRASQRRRGPTRLANAQPARAGGARVGSPASDLDQFHAVKPKVGPSAEEIIRYHLRAEQPVAVFHPGAGRPVVTAAAAGSTSPAGVTDVHPTGAAPTAALPAAQPDVVLPVDQGRVRINGKTTVIDSAVGLDRRGKPVLVDVNIGRHAGGKVKDRVGPVQGGTAGADR